MALPPLVSVALSQASSPSLKPPRLLVLLSLPSGDHGAAAPSSAAATGSLADPSPANELGGSSAAGRRSSRPGMSPRAWISPSRRLVPRNAMLYSATYGRLPGLPSSRAPFF